MTNKEAIRILGLECDDWETSHCTPSERREAFDMAISALQAQDIDACRVPEVAKDTNVLNNDTISRQTAIDALKMDISIIPFAKAREYVRAAIETIYNRLEQLPSVQPEDCSTCKHGYFGDEQCNNCCVRFASHYERRTDGQTKD